MEIRGGLAEGGVDLCGRLWGSGGSKVWHLANHFHRGMAVWMQIWSSTNLLLQYMVGYHALPQSRGGNLPEAVWVYYLEISRLRQRRHAPGASSLLHIGVWVAREVETQNQAVGRPWCNHSHRSCRLLSWHETLDLLLPTDTSTGCLVPAAANSTRAVHSRSFGTQVLEVLLLQVSLARQFFRSRRALFAFSCGWWQQRGQNRYQHQHAGWCDFWPIRVALLVEWTGTG